MIEKISRNYHWCIVQLTKSNGRLSSNLQKSLADFYLNLVTRGRRALSFYLSDDILNIYLEHPNLYLKTQDYRFDNKNMIKIWHYIQLEDPTGPATILAKHIVGRRIAD